MAVMELLESIKINLYGKEAIVVGHSEIVGKPLALMLLNKFATTTVCHIATGERGRDYRELFMHHDIMVLGPGMYGDARQVSYAEGAPNSAKRQVYNFAHSPKPGDRVLMRFYNEVIGVGQIPTGDDNQYSFNLAFLCVYGWDLRHCRRVVWAEGLSFSGLKDVYRKAKQKPSFTKVNEAEIILRVKDIDNSHFNRNLKDMPEEKVDQYSEEELGIELFKAGISNKNIEDILKALEQADRLWSWYSSHENSGRPTEHEIVSHMSLPIFLGLGWSHQQIAVEWQKVDMAFFKSMPATPENCVMILEAKGWGQPLCEIFEQPYEYIKKLELRNVKYILVTDGANLFVYGKSGKEWSMTPIGYINIWSLQKEYLLPTRTNLIKTLVGLQPGAI